MSLDESAPASQHHGASEGAGSFRFGRSAEVFVLLILAVAPSYGYEIRKRLEEFSYFRTANDPGVLYRLLRDMEAGGWITSEWNVAGSGPARRYYHLTELGRENLIAGAKKLVLHKQRIERFLETYEALGLSLPERSTGENAGGQQPAPAPCAEATGASQPAPTPRAEVTGGRPPAPTPVSGAGSR